jgi:hypothetical protein
LRRLLSPFITLAALLLLAYEWLWEALRAQLHRLRRWSLVRQLELRLQRLPPWPSLGVMALPLLVLLPFKFAALWALGHGHQFVALGIYLAAKLLGMGLVSYVFEQTSPSARRLPWFDRLCSQVLGLVARAKAWVHSRPAVQAARALARRARARVRQWWAQQGR